MGDLKVKDKEIVVPGEILATGMDFLPAGGAFRENESLISSQVGIVTVEGRLVKVVPLNSVYLPKRGDMVIGKVMDISASCWYIDIGFANEGVLPLRDGSYEYIPRGADLYHYYNHGDYVVAEILSMNRGKPDLTMKGPGLRKLNGGRIVYINTAKIPRLIGKQGSMVSMIKQKTDCRIVAGQNGTIWVSGADPVKEAIAVEAIKMIEENAHKSGLTDEIQKFLDSKIDSKIDSKVVKQNDIQ